MIFEKVKKIVQEEAGIDDMSIANEVVTLESKFIDDLGLDSVVLMSIIQRLEDAFGMPRVENQDLVNFKSIGNVVEYIKEKKS